MNTKPFSVKQFVICNGLFYFLTFYYIKDIYKGINWLNIQYYNEIDEFNNDDVTKTLILTSFCYFNFVFVLFSLLLTEIVKLYPKFKDSKFINKDLVKTLENILKNHFQHFFAMFPCFVYCIYNKAYRPDDLKMYYYASINWAFLRLFYLYLRILSLKFRKFAFAVVVLYPSILISVLFCLKGFDNNSIAHFF